MIALGRLFGWTTPLGLLAIALGASQARAEDWGNLKGQFVFGGNPPKPAPVQITKDVEVCGAHKLVDEAITVKPDNKGIANVLIFLSLERGEKPPKMHESYAQNAAGEVHLDNKGCRFEPRVTLMRTGQTLVVGNSDSVAHNTKLDCLRNTAMNAMIPVGSQIKQVLKDEERLPVRVSCSIHPWMTGWVLVKDQPYAAVSDADGKFEIANLPVGKYTFQVWHEYKGGGYVDRVNWKGKDQKWKKGKVQLEIKPGDNDLGTITIPASFFGS